MSIIDILKNAIENRSSIKIKYNGGSKPGSSREIVPNKMDNDKLIARCLTTKSNKSFFINKIEIPEENTPVNYDDYIVSENTIIDINKLYKISIDTLEGLGWKINYIENESIGLYKYYKNGNVMKHPTILIEYSEYIRSEIWIDVITMEAVEPKKSSKPWLVYVKNKNTRSFSNFNNAAIYFLEQSKI